MNGFWEAKTLDFRIFFVIFSKQILKNFLEGEKIEKNGQQSDKAVKRLQFLAGPAECAWPGGEIERG